MGEVDGTACGKQPEQKQENRKAYQAVIEELLKLSNGLTRIAVHIKGLGQMGGATVEVAVAQGPSGKILVAGLNSSAREGWTPRQRNELKTLGIVIAPQIKGLKKAQPHAEENLFFELEKLDAKALKFSNARVGEGKWDSDVCPNCRRIIRRAGASIEPGMHESTDAPAPASGRRCGSGTRALARGRAPWTGAMGGSSTTQERCGLWDASANRWTNVGATRRPEGTPGATGP